MSKIITKNLKKFYGNFVAVDNLNIEVNTGEVVSILGPNGAGKTTAFYTMVGISNADEGSIFLDEHDITHIPMYKRGKLGIGYLPQEQSIFRGLTVEQNIAAILELSEQNKNQRYERLETLLEEFKIQSIRKHQSVILSGGERRRLEIARLLAANPKFVFLDEPFAGVDPVSVDDINKLIINLAQKDIGIIITDHNVRETLKITDRNYILYRGKILTSGTREEVLRNHDVQKYYLGTSFES